MLFPMMVAEQALELIRPPSGATLKRAEQIKNANALPKESAIVSFNPKHPKIRVTADSDQTPIGLVRCDIGLSEFLVTRPSSQEHERVIRIPAPNQPQPQQPILYERLLKAAKDGEQARLLFESDLGTSAASVFVTVKMTARGRQFIVEIEPRFILPSGYEDTFSEKGIARGKAWIEQLDRKTAELPSVQASLLRQKNSREKEVFERICGYAEKFPKEGNIYVRIYIGNQTLPGKVKY